MREINDRRNSDGPLRDLALEYLDGLWDYAMSLTRNKPEAEDLVQATYLHAIRCFDRSLSGSNEKVWLFTILRNVYLNEVSNQKSGPPIVDLDDQCSDPPASTGSREPIPLGACLTSIKRQDVQRAVESLPSQYREVIILREFENLSYQQIAEVLDCPTGTVMSRLARARVKLKAMRVESWISGTS
jgi:RNA polymerase sigma-70 factor, ECF subfamily